MIDNLNAPEDMNSLSVAATGKESSTGGEGERIDRGRSLQASTQLVQFCSVVARENPVRGKFSITCTPVQHESNFPMLDHQSPWTLDQ